ncbi:hypothetical protein [Chitiniphilus eburneus]|uniref:Uncharacterized protein n=1 Tax=Chitiniphilus eburneus TaxID=2571148 RepID=A0A4U0Q5F9_9NEIS|nr:hypothetical protein [Chitiniphilus eburneus]TJZ76319.1 hypothetical protein FAZ21_05970 [Chitiniphilus eburneus]
MPQTYTASSGPGFSAIPLPSTPQSAFLPPSSAHFTPLSVPSTFGPGASTAFPSIPSISQPTSPTLSSPALTTPLTAQPTQSATPTLAASTSPPTVKFRLDDTGKVHYQAKDDTQARTDHAAHYMEMNASDFALFKNAGKRSPSNKVMDPVSGDKYVFDAQQNTFFGYDKSKAGKRGAEVDASLKQELLGKQQNKQLVDRRREDRTKSGQDTLKPFDVGHYKQAPGGSRFDVLSGKKEEAGFVSNRDHIPSGASLQLRDGQSAYNQGLTIAIPNEVMHRPSSSTYGGRQTTKDTLDSNSPSARKSMDSDHSGLAFYRDTTTMLSRTADTDFTQQSGAKHDYLDLTKPENRVRQVGAYRTLYRGNTRMYAADQDRGVNPSETGHTVSHAGTSDGRLGAFTYTQAASGSGGSGTPTQGSLMVGHFQEALRNTKLAK